MDLTFGARLRQQREQRQVALAAIAEETKISAALLEGLERDDVSRWPGGLFRRAYVRAYAHRIGLDPEQVVREFMERHPDPVEEASPVEALADNAGITRRPRTRLGLLLASLASKRPARAADAASRPPTATWEARVEPIANAPAPTPGPAGEAETGPPVEHAGADTQPSPRLIKVPSIESGHAARDGRVAERHVIAAARLCTRIACAADERDLTAALAEIVNLLDARGAIVWVWDEERAFLSPVLTHGYPEEILVRLPEVRRSTDNAIALAFRAGQKRVVRGDTETTGAYVAPLLAPDGCVGVLALEFGNGGEQHELAQALATIVAAQLSMLIAGAPHSAEDKWQQPDESLAAS